MAIKDEGLKSYAHLLESKGFAIYEPKGIGYTSGSYFTYSRLVDGQECFGTVQAEHFGGYTHTMPIKPSRENGSSMWVAKLPGQDDNSNDGSYEVLTVEAAEMVARPTNSNPLVGTQKNYKDAAWLERGYAKRGEK
ncbi:hypothetical protein [Mycobacterium phage WXIN]|nr:hypothetical protein [Mycobacterium phage WXIN]